MIPQHDAANHKALSNWTVSVNNRYFKSYKHFVGKEEQHERVEAGTEVINHFASTEFGISRNLIIAGHQRYLFPLLAMPVLLCMSIMAILIKARMPAVAPIPLA